MEIIANTELVIAAKLLLAIILAGFLGLERSIAKKTAGMRTYMLVAMGATVFIIISELVTQNYLELGIRVFDPLRVASQVVVGIGFLGAGLIIVQNNKLYGLTTAAGLWVAAGLGMAVGYGFYVLAALITLFTLFVFTVLWYVERYVENKIDGERQNPEA